MNIKEIKDNVFIRNIIILVSGSLGAQIVNMIAIPIITRIYGPEAYGLMGSFVAITAILIPIAALTYPIGIVLPKSNSEAKGIAKLSMNITVILSLFFLLIIFLFKEQLVNFFNLQQISNYLYLLPLVILLSGTMQILEQWMIRNNQYSINAKATFLQSFIVNGGNIGFGLINPIASVLIVFASLKSGISALLMYIISLKSGIPLITKRDKKKISLRKIAKKYRDFPIFRAPEAFLNDLSQSLPILMLASFFGPAAVGYYTISRTVLNLPSQLIGKAVGDVFYPRINRASKNKEDISGLLIKVTSILGIIGIIPFGLVIILGPSLFSFVFGDKWSVGGEYARWIALWTYFSFIYQPSIRILPVLNAQKFHLMFTICMLLGRAIAIVVGYSVFNDDVIAVALFSIVGAILSFSLIIATIYLTKKFTARY